MDTVTAQVPPPRRRRRFRPLRWLFLLLLLLVALVAALPYVATAGPVLRQGLGYLRPHLRAEVQVASARAGWTSGLTLTGVRVAQPPDYPEGDMFSVQSVRVTCPLWDAAQGQPDVAVAIVAPKVKMIRRKGDRWNVLEARVPSTTAATPPPDSRPADARPFVPPRVRFDLSLTQGEIEVWEEDATGQFRPLESIRNLTVQVRSTDFAPPYEATLAGELTRASDQGGPGRIELKARVDPRQPMPLLLAELSAKAFSLDHYAPLLAALGGPLTRTDGQLDGTLQVTPVDAQTLAIGGQMVMSRVHLAGPALGTRELVADRWVLEPGARVATDGSAFDLSGLALDLGFARVRGLDQGARQALGLGGPGTTGFAVDLDLARLLALPGMKPAGVDAAAGLVHARVAASLTGARTVKLAASTEPLTLRGASIPAHLPRLEPMELSVECGLDAARAGKARLTTRGAAVDAEFRAPADQPIATQTTATLDLEALAALRPFLPASLTSVTGTVLMHLGATADLTTGLTRFTADAEATRPGATGTAIPAGLKLPESLRLTCQGSFDQRQTTLELPVATLDFPGTTARLNCSLPGLRSLRTQLTARIDGGAGAELIKPFLPQGVALLGATEIECTADGPLPGPQVDQPAVLKGLTVQGTLKAPNLTYLGNQLENVTARLDVKDGRAAFTVPESTRLNGGKVTMDARYVLTGDAAQPAQVKLAWDGGKAIGSLTPLLGYVVPLLSGLEARTLTEYAGLDFSSGIQVQLDLSGPTLKKPEESWLTVFNRWRGTGNLKLADGAFTTGSAVTELLSALGQDKKLQFQQIAAAFKIQDGFLVNDNLQLSGKGGRLGLSGRTGLDGAIDYQVDVTEMLRGHKDGERILKALGKGRARAALKGTLWSPKVDLTDTFSALVENLGDQLIDDFTKDPEKTLDSIRDLFRKKKKDEPRK